MTDQRLVQPAPRLMEINWFWRRLWSFLVTIILLAIVGFLVWQIGRPGLTDAQALGMQHTAWASLGLIAFVGSIYVGGATIYEFWQLASAVRVDRAFFARPTAALGAVIGREDEQ